MATDRVTSRVEAARTAGQFSTFFVADLFFGVDVLDVQEVLRSQQMTSVPQAPAIIEGLINLRGQIVTAVDMRRRLMLFPRTEGQSPMNMVVRTADGAVSLVVDEIGDVLDVDAAAYERSPANLDASIRELICGVYKLNDRLLLVLDIERAVEAGSGQAPKNENLEASPPEASPPRRYPASRDAIAPSRTEPATGHESVKRGNRKIAAIKTSDLVTTQREQRQ